MPSTKVGLGRIVRVTLQGVEWPAIVYKVEDDQIVGLYAFTAGGILSINAAEEKWIPKGYEEGAWHWPPEFEKKKP